MNVVLRHWSYDPVLPVVLLSAVVYGVGEGRRRRAVRRAGHRVRNGWRAPVFLAGLVALALGVASPVDYWSDQYLFAHMLQHLLLAFVAPALIVLGAPWLALRRGLPAPLRVAAARVAQGVHRSPRWRAAARAVTDPVLAFVLFNAAMVVWHLPGPFDLALRNQTVHVWVDHTSLFVFGVLLWVQLLESPPFRPRWSPLLREGAAVGTNAVMVGVAMTLVLFSRPLYAVYAGGPHLLLSQAADQQVAGSALWVCGEFTLAPLLYWNVVLWLRSAGPVAPMETVAGPWGRLGRRWRTPAPDVVEMGWHVRKSPARGSLPQ